MHKTDSKIHNRSRRALGRKWMQLSATVLAQCVGQCHYTSAESGSRGETAANATAAARQPTEAQCLALRCADRTIGLISTCHALIHCHLSKRAKVTEPTNPYLNHCPRKTIPHILSYLGMKFWLLKKKGLIEQDSNLYYVSSRPYQRCARTSFLRTTIFA